MHDVNGLSLSTAEYVVLQAIADRQPASAGVSFEDYSDIADRLAAAGLVRRRSRPDSAEDEATALGLSFVDDLRKSARMAEEAEASRRRHDRRMVLLSTVSGGIMGLFSGALASWLIQLIQTATAAA